MATRAQKIRLGLFAVLSAAVLAVVLITFAGLRFWEDAHTYYVETHSSALGLDVGSRVTMSGIRVGTVEAVDLVPQEPGLVRITIEVDEATPIRTDTLAYLTFAGITGLKIIDLRGGTVGAPMLQPGGTIESGTTTLDRLQDQASVLAERTAETMGKVDSLLDNLIAITEPSQFDGMDEAFADARLAARNLARTSEELHAMVRENRTALRGTIASVGDAARRVSETLDEEVGTLAEDAGGLVADLRAVVRTNRGQLHTAMTDLRQASRSFKELARELRQRPSQLFFSRPPRERELP